MPEAFYLATMGGAALCRLDNVVGNFVPGKEFDALRIKPRSPGVWVHKGEKVEDRFAKWIWAGDDRDIREVYVRGRLVGGSSR
jgi:guanine deaminase